MVKKGGVRNESDRDELVMCSLRLHCEWQVCRRYLSSVRIDLLEVLQPQVRVPDHGSRTSGGLSRM